MFFTYTTILLIRCQTDFFFVPFFVPSLIFFWQRIGFLFRNFSFRNFDFFFHFLFTERLERIQCISDFFCKILSRSFSWLDMTSFAFLFDYKFPFLYPLSDSNHIDRVECCFANKTKNYIRRHHTHTIVWMHSTVKIHSAKSFIIHFYSTTWNSSVRCKPQYDWFTECEKKNCNFHKSNSSAATRERTKKKIVSYSSNVSGCCFKSIFRMKWKKSTKFKWKSLPEISCQDISWSTFICHTLPEWRKEKDAKLQQNPKDCQFHFKHFFPSIGCSQNIISFRSRI